MHQAIAHSPGPWVFIGDPQLGQQIHHLLDQAGVVWHSWHPDEVSDWGLDSQWGTTLILDSRDLDAPWLAGVISVVERLVDCAVVAVGQPHSSFAETLPQDQLTPWSVRQLMIIAGYTRHQQIAGDARDRDPLTGCARRSVIQRQLGEVLDQSVAKDQPMAYLMVDLSGVKEVNARRGEQAGDRALQSVAHALRSSVRIRDTVARVDGTTFAVLCREIRGSMRVFDVAEKIQLALKQSIAESKVEGWVSYSMGVAVYPDGQLQVAELARSAELAMVRARRQGTNACRFFTEAMGIQRRRQLNLKSRLQEAIHQEHFSLSFRPQWFFSAGCVKAVEARMYWVDPEAGVQDYQTWMQVAIETGLLQPIRHWATRELCRLISELGESSPRFAIDLSIHQLLSDGFEATTLRILNEEGVSPDRLCFELQEGELQSQAIRLITRLSECGFSWVLDHFGSGGINFRRLEQWPLLAVKLSAERVAQISEQGEHEQMLRGLVSLCREMHLGIGADGVNTAQQLHRLEHLGVHYAQGQAISEVMDRDQLLSWLPQHTLAKQPV